MKSAKEIEVAVTDMFSGHALDRKKVEVTPITHGGKPGFEIKVSAMYGAPSFTGEGGLLGLVKAFEAATGASNLDVVDEFSHEGCPTCDWGSSYGKTYRVW